MRKRLVVHLLVTASLVALSVPAQAEKEVFRWVDENGVVHYSDRPTDPRARPTGLRYEPTDPTAVSNRVMREQYEEQQAQASEIEVRQEPPSENETLLEQQERIRQLECKAARDRLEAYTDAPRLYETLPNGERRYLTDEELDRARAGAREDIKRWCE